MTGKRSLVSVVDDDESVRESLQDLLRQCGRLRPLEQTDRWQLGISEITVKAHRSQVMRKMKADSRPDLVTMAARLGLRSALQG
jgi:FixJ family two-component response regulator